MENIPEYLGLDTSSTEEQEYHFDTQGTSIDFAFEIEDDSDCEEDLDNKYEE
jgi:hypothetical protein